MDSVNEMQVVKTQGNFTIIKIADGRFCVRKKYKSLFGFGKEKQTFMVLDRNGTDMTYDSIFAPVTVGDLERCEYVFNANILKTGGI